MTSPSAAVDRLAAEVPDAFAGLPGERVRYAVARMLGLRLISDIYERACDLNITLPAGAKRRRRLVALRHAGALFIHIPKNAGQSVSHALYGMQVKHASIRYYRRAAPDLARLPSFAILRDPVERFASAYHYARQGGHPDNRITPGFFRIYSRFGGVDDALDHVEAARSVYDVDHVFRPQSWYVTDRHGAVAVDRLLDFSELAEIERLVPGCSIGPVGHLNRLARPDHALTPAQAERVRRLYAADVALIAGARAARG
ncbi:sulfotransferase family protein [Sphingomonas nostoxanthinifaciens]|uniref:sulfotransferase n=1 Tax=Sphingomonas nostoxanthinifaciens TaxID=2872652 RepID=UPI001CC21BD8|nr:sulfotransferase [Sphingomonas nostoxanthinifaciens]UAK23338.1 sulfotransferase [Sphingomonas nostoxanthinifaciens]